MDKDGQEVHGEQVVPEHVRAELEVVSFRSLHVDGCIHHSCIVKQYVKLSLFPTVTYIV